MTTPIPYSIDDKDFDDAALWAVIDSAEATHSSTKFRKQPLAIKYPSLQSPPTPISHPSPPPKVPQNPNKRRAYHNNHYSSNTDSYSRPHKMGTSCVSEVSESTSPLALVRTPVTNTSAKQFSPESYLSPQIGKLGAPEFNEGLEASAGSFVRGGEKEAMRHCLNGRFPSVSLFKDYQNAAIAILEKSDFTMISGNPFIKKSGWRKISFYFNISYEIKDRTIEFDDNRNVQRAEFVVRAHMQGGRFSDGWGSCERREKRFLKPNHDIPSTAETRAKNKACQDLLGIGEYRPGLSHFHQ